MNGRVVKSKIGEVFAFLGVFSLLLLQLSEEAKAVRKQRKQRDRRSHPTIPNSLAKNKNHNQESKYSKLKERICITSCLLSSLYNMWFL